MMAFIGLLTFLVCTSQVFAQAPDTLWTRTFGGGSLETCRAGTVLNNGNIILVGSTYSFGAGQSDIWVLNLSSTGTLNWSRTIGGTANDEAWSVVQTSDQNIVIGGNSASFGNRGWDIFLVKLSLAGDSLWSRQFGGVADDKCWDLIEDFDNGLLISGSLGSAGIIMKTNSEGDSVWGNTLIQGQETVYYSLCRSGSAYFACGHRLSSPGSTSNDLLYSKFDVSGATIWTRVFEVGPEAEAAYEIRSTSDGGAVMTGIAQSFGAGAKDFYIVRLNGNGDSIWTKTFGTSQNQWGFAIDETCDGGFMIAGTWQQLDHSFNFGLLRIDSQGDSIWSRVSDVGGECWFVDFTESQSIIFAGFNNNIVLASTEPDILIDCNGSISYPNGLDQVYIFSTDTIRWTGVGFDGGVSIKLNRHYPIGAWETITDSTENDGQYEWFVTDPLSDSCRIRICALQDTFCDTSDGNFSIVSSQGYLGLIRSSAPNPAVTVWNAGDIECPSNASQTFRIKNFGSEPIVVFQPLEPASAEFSRTTTCGSFFALAPGGISTCSLTVSFAPVDEGLIHDTLLIQTDAVNGVSGFVNIPLSGSQIRTPESPEVVISSVGNNAVLRWSPIVESIGYCQIDPPSYLVFFSEDPDGPFWFHGITGDTAYTHAGAVQYASSMFYHVYAVQANAGLHSMLSDYESEIQVLESDVFATLSTRRTLDRLTK